MASFGFILNILIISIYKFYSHEKIIKASSRQLSATILIGSTLGYITVLLFISKPSFVTCLINRIGFHMTVCIIYAPLLMKTQRVYRIFKAGSKGKQRPKFVSNHAQMIATLCLVITELILVTISLVIWKPGSERIQKVEIEKRVELTCKNPLPALILPLSFNILLLLLCGIYGYLSRKLPENFNESWYIFVSVATTIFLWIVFLPTYFTMFYVYYKVIILAICLIINATLTLLCLFMPKIYALFFISEEDLIFGTMTKSEVTKVGPSSIG